MEATISKPQHIYGKGGKKALYKTARISKLGATVVGYPAGHCVAVEYQQETWNALYGEYESVYFVTGNGVEPTYLFQRALEGFTL